ncbi:hypothetical protein FOFC_20484, partial [Fusarium oxysporum]
MDASVVYGLDLPDAPKAPDVPKPNTGPRNPPSDESETSYTDPFKTYLHQWVEWDNKVIDHFEARCGIYAIRASETQWHLSGDGRREYLTCWLQDFDVLRTWYNVGSTKVSPHIMIKVYPKPFLATMSSQRTPRFTMQTRNTVRVPSSRRSAQSRTGSPDHQTNQLSNDDSTPTVFEKNTLFLPKELKLIGPSNWEQFSPAQKAILRINGLEDAVFGDYPSEDQMTTDQKIKAAKAAISIRGNCTGEALSQLVGMEDPKEMFNLLQGYCVGSGPVLLQTTLYQFIRIKTSFYETIPQAVDGLTPLESFLNEVSPGQDNKPDLSGERICGSQVTIHIPQERRLRSHKFGPRGETGIYINMEGSQIYTCWVPSRRKGHRIVRSANVTFYEKVGEKDLQTGTEHDVEPIIRTNGAPISCRPQSALERTETPMSNKSEVHYLQHTEVHYPPCEQTTTSETSVQQPDPRKEEITEPKTMTEALQ